MWNKIIIFCFLFFATNSFAQKEGWIEDFPEAFELSVETGKPILANFTGSDWCGWCIKLDNAVFQTEEFKKWANENVILLELDFPRRKQLDPEIEANNNYLQSIFQVRGFPTIWIFTVQQQEDKKFSINAQVEGGQGWQKMGYMSSASSFIQQAENIITNISTVFIGESESE
tara:strand:- start:7 stop:522 length:516 start_codon:yes stop_codon:yes gene_type:complete